MQDFYDQSWREAIIWWHDPSQRSQVEVSEEEAAYTVLENLGLLLRHHEPDSTSTDQANLPSDFVQMAQDKKVRLVKAACNYALNFSLPSHFTRILETECLEPEEIEEVEHVLCQIDAMDAAVSIAVRLVRVESDSDDDLLAKLVRVRCLVAKLVEYLSVRPDIVSVASRLVLVQRRPRYLEDGRPADWFTKMRHSDQCD